MADLPQLALSIRQPWAWAIINAGKDIENRSWPTKVRGQICIHAGLHKDTKGTEWDACMVVLDQIHGAFSMRELVSKQGRLASARHSEEAARGGIIGTATITDCVSASDSPWFFGKWGFVLTDVQPVPFILCKGALGFFDWRKVGGHSDV